MSTHIALRILMIMMLLPMSSEVVAKPDKQSIHTVSKYGAVAGLLATLGVGGYRVYLSSAIRSAKSPEKKAKLMAKMALFDKAVIASAFMTLLSGGTAFWTHDKKLAGKGKLGAAQPGGSVAATSVGNLDGIGSVQPSALTQPGQSSGGSPAGTVLPSAVTTPAIQSGAPLHVPTTSLAVSGVGQPDLLSMTTSPAVASGQLSAGVAVSDEPAAITAASSAVVSQPGAPVAAVGGAGDSSSVAVGGAGGGMLSLAPSVSLSSELTPVVKNILDVLSWKIPLLTFSRNLPTADMAPYLNGALCFASSDLNSRLWVKTSNGATFPLYAQDDDSIFMRIISASGERVIGSCESSGLTLHDLQAKFSSLGQPAIQEIRIAWTAEKVEIQKKKVIADYLADVAQNKAAFEEYNFTGDNQLENLPYFVGVTEIGGLRAAKYVNLPSAMEDACCVQKFGKNWCFGVFDGHGDHQKVAKHCAQTLGKQLIEALGATTPAGANEAIRNVFIAMERSLVQEGVRKRFGVTGGTTVAMALYDKSSSILRCINLGDSRVIIVNADGGCAVATIDHEPTDGSVEDTRITSAGGSVYGNRVSIAGVGFSQGCVLAVARSLGDNASDADHIGVRPQIITLTLPPDGTGQIIDDSFYTDEGYYHANKLAQGKTQTVNPSLGTQSFPQNASVAFIVIACDGIWDQMTNEQVSAFVKQQADDGKNCQEVSENLVKEAHRIEGEKLVKNSRSSTDNMSCIVLSAAELVK